MMDPCCSSANSQFVQSRQQVFGDQGRSSWMLAKPWSTGQLRSRVFLALESGGWGTLLVLIDVYLSVMSALLYILGTYLPVSSPLAYIQLALAGYFFLNWLLWLWVDEDRLSYVISWGTLVDALTILPEAVLFALAEAASVAATAETLPDLNVLRVLRILRVLRLLRLKQVVRRHMGGGAVSEAAAKLGFTLLCLLLIAAGLFYELQKYGPPRESDLTFHEALYWAAVTITTVGYGDIAPTWWATQMMLIALLVLTFTVLPYLTSELMSALTSTSKYQRNSYKPPRRPGAHHIVVTGAFDGDALEGLLDELYHTNKGYSRHHTVILCDKHPSTSIKHVLYTHRAAKSVTYIQGSPFRVQDLDRAAVVFADAILILAPKYPPDPAAADMQSVMTTLSLGRYLEDAHASLRKRLCEGVEHAPHRLWHWIRHNKVTPPARLPAIFQQLCLPAGLMGLQRVLAGFQSASSSGWQCSSNSSLQLAVHNSRNAAQGNTRHAESTAAARNASSNSSSRSASGDYHSAKSESHMVRAAGAGSFWEEFSGSIHLLCLSEIKYAMMAQSVVGVPGAMTLLCNLSKTVDFGDAHHAWHPEVDAGLPDWLQEYMFGASQELYQLQHFPACLIGCCVREAAGFLFDVFHAVLLAVDSGQPGNHTLYVGDLDQVITADMHGYVIADNSSILQAILGVQFSDIQHWWQGAKLQQQHTALDAGYDQPWKLPTAGSGQRGGHAAAAAAAATATATAAAAAEGQPGQLCADVLAGVQSPMGALLHRLRSPSSALQQEGQAVLQGHYHMRPPADVQSCQDLLATRVNLRGHILLLGVPHDQEGLIALLAALRSRQLQSWRPVVIVDRQGPGQGGSWDVVAQFQDVYCIKITHDLNDALLRASAEHAVQAVLTAPLTLLDDADEDPLTASVTTDAKVVATYHLLKALNPDMQVLAELMLPYNMAYLLPAPTPLLGDPHSSQAHLLTPAWMTGSVFHAQVLDDMLVANYCNSNATTRIILELLLSWHTNWAHTLLQPVPQMPNGFDHTRSHTVPASARQHKSSSDIEQGKDQTNALPAASNWAMGGSNAGSVCSWQVQQQELHHQQQQQEELPQQPSLPLPPQQQHNRPQHLQQQQQQQQELHHQQQQREGLPQQLSLPLPLQQQHNRPQHLQQEVQQVYETAASLQQPPPWGCAPAAVAVNDRGGVGATGKFNGQHYVAPASAATLLQIPAECPPGTTYGRYFHLLLHTRGLLLLGVYRRVGGPGQAYRVVITNARQDCLLQPDDHAFVVAQLPLPADCSDSAAVAAAWPPDILGFGHLHHTTPQQPELLVPPCRSSTEQQYSRSNVE